MSPALFEQEVVASLDRSVVAFNEGRSEFFDDFAADAMIFTVDSGDPIRGREAYRQQHLSALTGRTRQKTIVHRSVQIVGEKAVVTQTARITEAGVTADVRQTIVYGDTSEGLKVLHHHTARLAPQGAAASAALPLIRVLNEKVASVAPVLGVAQ